MRTCTRNIVAFFVGGTWQTNGKATNTERNNFVIVCDYGDWSGFRTLADCTKQQMDTKRPDGFYWIEQR